MRQIVIELNDERLFIVDAEGLDASTVATLGAAQTDEHRAGLWTLKEGNHILQPSQPISDYFKHGDHARLHLFEKHARETPAGSTHPDDQEPFAVRLRRLADEADRVAVARADAAQRAAARADAAQQQPMQSPEIEPAQPTQARRARGRRSTR